MLALHSQCDICNVPGDPIAARSAARTVNHSSSSHCSAFARSWARRDSSSTQRSSRSWPRIAFHTFSSDIQGGAPASAESNRRSSQQGLSMPRSQSPAFGNGFRGRTEQVPLRVRWRLICLRSSAHALLYLETIDLTVPSRRSAAVLTCLRKGRTSVL